MPSPAPTSKARPMFWRVAAPPTYTGSVRTRLALAVLLGGCSVLDPSLLPEGDAGPAVDAPPAEDAPSAPDSGGSGAVCMGTPSRTPPARPAGEDADGPEVVFALKEVLLNQRAEWQNIGFDLDGLCSEPPVPMIECEPPNAPDVSPLLDGNAGIDNAFGGELFPTIELVFPELDTTAAESAEVGVGAVILWLRGWNGTANDPRVDVTLSQSVTGTSGTAEQTEAPEAEIGEDYLPYAPGTMDQLPEPAWDGNDWLWLREETFFMGALDRPRVRDDNAYVADGQLVLRLPDRVEIVFAGDGRGIRVKLSDAVAVGTFNEDLTRLEPVTFGGRWSIIDLLDTASSIGGGSGDDARGVRGGVLSLPQGARESRNCCPGPYRNPLLWDRLQGITPRRH